MDRLAVIPDTAFQPLLDLLAELDSSPRPADAVTSGFVRARADLPEALRGAVLEEAYAILRHRARLGWWLERLGQADRPRTRILLWRALFGTGRLPAGLSAAERQWLDAMRGKAPMPSEMPETVRLECPDWAVVPLRRRFAEAFAAEMAATLLAPPLDLRVNPVKTTRAAKLKELRGLGLPVEPMRLAAQGIRVKERLSLVRIKGLKGGEVEIQDEGSQLVAELVAARPGERVVDFCAGAGGKTLALGAMMRNTGRLYAFDVSGHRLDSLKPRLARSGLSNVYAAQIAHERDDRILRLSGKIDRVLVDAPCSGLGTLRRNPDLKWRQNAKAIEELRVKQAAILRGAARLLKPGGRLVYATCSVLQAENEAVAEAFTQEGGHAWRVLPAEQILQEARVDRAAELVRGAYLRLWPHRHRTDGFFAAAWERV